MKSNPEHSTIHNILSRIIFFIFISRNVLAVVFGMGLAYKLEQIDGKIPFQITGGVVAGLPPIKPPPFSTTFNGQHYSFTEMLSNFGALVIFCPMIAILEHMAVAKAYSTKLNNYSSRFLINFP